MPPSDQPRNSPPERKAEGVRREKRGEALKTSIAQSRACSRLRETATRAATSFDPEGKGTSYRNIFEARLSQLETERARLNRTILNGFQK